MFGACLHSNKMQQKQTEFKEGWKRAARVYGSNKWLDLCTNCLAESFHSIFLSLFIGSVPEASGTGY